jgi:LPS export ABC transporter protein LptC
MIRNIISIGLCVCFISCSRTKNEEGSIITRDKLKIETGKVVEIIYSDSAKIKVRILAPELLTYNDPVNPHQDFTEGVTVLFYDEKKQVQSTLTGKFAVRDQLKQKTFIRDSVVWQSTIDGRLETSELEWDEAKNIVSTAKFVKITQPGQSIFGYGFDTNQELSQWKIKYPKGTMKSENIGN